jgi:tetratricopeptide (TPR) repeat protein
MSSDPHDPPASAPASDSSVDAAGAASRPGARRALRWLLWGGMGVAFLVAAVMQLRRASPQLSDATRPESAPSAAAPPASEPFQPRRPVAGAPPAAAPPAAAPAALAPGAPAPAAPAPGAPPPAAAPSVPSTGGSDFVRAAAALNNPDAGAMRVSESQNPRFADVRKALSGPDQDAAYKAARELVKDYPNDQRSYIYTALAAHHTGEYERAGQALDQALAMKPSGSETGMQAVETMVYGGLVAYGLGRFAQAADLWEQAVKAFPQIADKYQPLIDEARAKAAAGAGGPPSPKQ